MPPREAQASIGSFTSQPLSPSHHPHQQALHQHQPAYGLLEPQDSIAINRVSTGLPARRRDRAGSVGSPPPIAPAIRRHRRKSSSFGRSVGRVVPAWDDVEAGIDTLKDRGAELGASIGALSHRLTDAVPGVRGSIVFLSILQSNIRLSAREGSASPFIPPIALPPTPPLPSLVDVAEPTMAARETGPADLPSTVDSAEALEAPELVYETPRDQDARIDGLKLVADSIAQMRQSAASVMIASFPFLMLLAAGPTLAYYFLYHSVSDYPVILTTTAGLTMAALISVRWALKGYLLEAERINWKWLGDDHLLVARFGKDIIGALVYSVDGHGSSSAVTPTGTATGAAVTERNGSAKTKRKGETKANSKTTSTTDGKAARAQIRAWTVRRRERGHGVGKALLEAATKICLRERQCEDVVFADEKGDRAGAQQMVLPIVARITGIAAAQRQKEERAQRCLSKVVADAQQGGG